ncbi:MAG: copper amine oxidase N-terminal domain-containing protein [Bacillota bacterium]
MKRNRKLVSILLTLSLLCAMLLPMAAPAAAAGTYSALSAPTVSDEAYAQLGKLKVEFDSGDIGGNADLFFQLPTDFKYYPKDEGVTYNQVVVGVDANDVYLGLAAGADKYVVLTAAGGDPSKFGIDDFTISKVSENEFKVSYNWASDHGDDCIFYLDFRKIYVPAYDGDITVKIDAPNGSPFSSGSVVIGKTTGGEVTVSAVDTTTGNATFDVKLRIKENVTGALKNEADSLKFILPDGYEWVTTDNAFVSTQPIWGQDLGITKDDFSVDKEELSFNPGAKSTTAATCFEVTLRFEVTDETDVTAGDIEMKIKGESTVSPSTLVVGTYGDYSAKAYAVDADDLPTVYAGKIEQEVSNIQIDEAIKGSLIANRYIKLELPSNARWTKAPSSVTDGGVTLNFTSVAGSEGNVLKYTVSGGPSTSAAELELEDFEVALDVMAPGDLKVKVTGTAGVEGEFAIAKVAMPITATADSKTEVKIGVGSQKVGDITITEQKAGAIKDGKSLVLKVPAGCEFSKLPKVEVTSGDLKFDNAQIRRAKTIGTTQPTDYYQYLVIPVDNDSNEASSIKVSDIYVSVDRTVAEGDLKVAVLGDAVLESNTAYKSTDMTIGGVAKAYSVGPAGLFPATGAVAAVPVGTIITPAPGDTKASAAFVIGSTTFKLNGVEQTMEVAPYIKGDRTYLPLRYVGYALGIADANMLWDQATQKVTLIKGNTIVQLTIGSNILMVNGMPITMDVAPEISNDRTCLPIRFVAQVFGASVGWDDATQTATIN